MEVFVEISCPYCGVSYEIGVDPSVSEQLLTTDCENCCRPFSLSVVCHDGEVVSAAVTG